MKQVIDQISLLCILTLLGGCLGMPSSVKPVQGFQKEHYLGKWYEIARLENRFERGLEKISAEYSLLQDGSIEVKNRGFSIEKNEWKESVGKAYFVNDESEAYLKVSFFGPFYGSYVIFEIDRENYEYAFISGPDLSYLWFLSRTPMVKPELVEYFKKQASVRGFDTTKLIFVNH